MLGMHAFEHTSRLTDLYAPYLPWAMVVVVVEMVSVVMAIVVIATMEMAIVVVEGEEEVEEEEEGGVVILTLLPSPQLLSPSNQKRLPMLVVAVVVILTLLLLEVEVRVVELIAVMQVVMLVARQVASPPQLQEKGQCLGGEVRVGCWRVCWDRARRVRTAMFPPRHKQRHPQVRAITFRDNLSYQPHTHPINHEPLPYHLIRAPITPLRKQLHPQVRAITYRDNIPC